jgi:hypothetical protein
MRPRVAAAVLTATLAAFVFLHVHRMGGTGWTWDEAGDLSIVGCIQKSGNAFDCLGDISQTRLPFLIHAAGPDAEQDYLDHYYISLAFSLMTLIVVVAFAFHAYGPGAAALTALLCATSIPILTAGRMLLSHGSIIFCFFSTLSFVGALLFARGGKRQWLVVSAIAFGASVASSAMGVLNILALLAIYIAARRYAWRDLLLGPVAVAVFFAMSVIYIDPDNFRALIKACLDPQAFGFWNYFETGASWAPWWFPPLILAVKIGPWWLILAAVCAYRARVDRLLVAFLVAFAANLFLKGAVFGYETPHHQVQWYPVLLVTIAAIVASAWNRAVMAAVALCLSIQVYDVVRFFPHYPFYGSQYGERFVGEFYGPAVLHGQGKEPLFRAVDKILGEDEDARILVADNNALELSHPRIVPFSKRDPRVFYEYAFVDRLYGRHFHFPERDAYNAMLARDYVPHYTYYFPPHMWVYRILRHR